MLAIALSLALQSQAPTLTLPPGFGAAPISFGATVTVVVPGVTAPPAPKTKTPAAALKAGAKLYAQRCALCHGDAGAADGVGARRIKPEPQHLNDVIWQGAVSDDEIKKAILEGGAAVSRSPMMPANPDLKKKPAVVKSLVAFVRSLRAPFGSVTASLSPVDPIAGTEPIVVRADADKTGTATVVFGNVPKGKATLSVMVDAAGTVGCTLEADIASDVTLQCPPR